VPGAKARGKIACSSIRPRSIHRDGNDQWMSPSRSGKLAAYGT
jgi:hypothetical protein